MQKAEWAILCWDLWIAQYAQGILKNLMFMQIAINLIIIIIHTSMLIHTESIIYFWHRSMLRWVNRSAYTRDEDKGLSNVSN